MNLENMEVEDIADYFGSVSRQRVSQIVKRFEGTAVFPKLVKAKSILKGIKKAERRALKASVKLSKEKVDYAKCRTIWHAMKSRCGVVGGSYENCTIDFSSFEDFSEWAKSQPGFNEPGFQLDKDILVKGNTVYSRETCAFVPRRINHLLIRCTRHRKRVDKKEPIGVSRHFGIYKAAISLNGKPVGLGYFRTEDEAFEAYKLAKEAEIRRVVSEYKDRLAPHVYEVLMAWKVSKYD